MRTASLPHQINTEDLEADYIVAMDESNLEDLQDFIQGRETKQMRKLLSYAGRDDDDIADPWYTGNFDELLSANDFKDVVA